MQKRATVNKERRRRESEQYETLLFKRRAKSRFDTEGIPIKEKKVLFVRGEAEMRIFLEISEEGCIEFPEVSSFMV